jgi:hypothetical protein
MVVLAQRSPGLREVVVTVGWVPRREEDHVIAVAKGHELQAPKPDHVANESGCSGSAIRKNGGKAMLARSVSLPSASTVGVRTREGPKPMSEFVLHAP